MQVSAFQRLVSNRAGKIIEGLASPLSEQNMRDVVDVFEHIYNGTVDYDRLEKLEKAGVRIPKALLMFSAFLEGSLTSLVDDQKEIAVKQLGTGLALTYRASVDGDYSKLPEEMRPAEPEPLVVGYYDFKEERTYLAPCSELSELGVFGGFYQHCMASTFVDAIKRLAALQNKAEEDPAMQRKPMTVSEFMEASPDNRSVLTYIVYVIMMQTDKKYLVCNKLADVKFEIDMRKQFLRG